MTSPATILTPTTAAVEVTGLSRHFGPVRDTVSEKLNLQREQKIPYDQEKEIPAVKDDESMTGEKAPADERR